MLCLFVSCFTACPRRSQLLKAVDSLPPTHRTCVCAWNANLINVHTINVQLWRLGINRWFVMAWNSARFRRLWRWFFRAWKIVRIARTVRALHENAPSTTSRGEFLWRVGKSIQGRQTCDMNSSSNPNHQQSHTRHVYLKAQDAFPFTAIRRRVVFSGSKSFVFGLPISKHL